MNAQEIIQLISSVGFPIVCCLGMGWYVKKQTDNYREDVDHLTQEHKDEMTRVTDALNNNTLAIQRLCDKLEK